MFDPFCQELQRQRRALEAAQGAQRSFAAEAEEQRRRQATPRRAAGFRGSKRKGFQGGGRREWSEAGVGVRVGEGRCSELLSYFCWERRLKKGLYAVGVCWCIHLAS